MEILIPAWDGDQLVPVEKLLAHIKGMKHRAVSIFLLAGDKVLVQQRAASKYHTPQLWANTVCTHPHWGEGTIDCAMRRLEEELSITGIDLEFKRTIEYKADVGQGLIEHEVVDIFVGRVDLDIPVIANADEVMAFEWLTLEDLKAQIQNTPEKFTPWIKIYMDKYSDVLD